MSVFLEPEFLLLIAMFLPPGICRSLREPSAPVC